MRRHDGIANGVPVWALLYGEERLVSASAIGELAYILAGTGCTPAKGWAVWEGGSGGQTPLQLKWRPHEEGLCEPLQPLRHCA